MPPEACEVWVWMEMISFDQDAFLFPMQKLGVWTLWWAVQSVLLAALSQPLIAILDALCLGECFHFKALKHPNKWAT